MRRLKVLIDIYRIVKKVQAVEVVIHNTFAVAVERPRLLMIWIKRWDLVIFEIDDTGNMVHVFFEVVCVVRVTKNLPVSARS